MNSWKYEVLVDKKENPRKCTIQAHRGRKDFRFRTFSLPKKIQKLEADFLLHVDGEDLSQFQARPGSSMALIDCTWKKVKPVLQLLESPLPRLVKIPEGFVTAYPRRNKEGHDPSEGLATIEALFIAAAFLGNWDETLLEKYYFKDQFLTLNESLWQKFHLGKYAKR